VLHDILATMDGWSFEWVAEIMGGAAGVIRSVVEEVSFVVEEDR